MNPSLHSSIHRPADLLAMYVHNLPTYLPTYRLISHVRTYLLAYLSMATYLPACLPTYHLPAYLPACLPTYSISLSIIH